MKMKKIKLPDSIVKIYHSIKLPLWLTLCLKVLLCSLAVQKSSLIQLEWGYDVELPLAKWFFSIFQGITGWGIETVFFSAALLLVFYVIHDHPLQKSGIISTLSIFAGIFMVVGRSYEELGTWDYILEGRLQFGLAVFVAAGYYLLYKNMIILGAYCLKKLNYSRTECKNAVEKYLFEKHPFLGPLSVIIIFSLPIIIAFWPGTLQWDALAQLLAYYGEINWDARYPVFITWLSGKCMDWGRLVGHSDNWGLFFFTLPQNIIQWFVFAYGMCILKKMNTPIIWRWITLLYFVLFPTWKMWAFSVGKDTHYYNFALLMMLLLLDIYLSNREKPLWWQWILLCISPLVCCLVRPNGILLISFTMIGALLLNRKRWKIYVICMAVSILPTVSLNYIAQNYWDIAPVPYRESLSIPMQQTARYLKYHYDELTPEEKEVLETVFWRNISALPYLPENVDDVKESFRIDASQEEVSAYLKVWADQFKKHPNTYIQAFLNHTYGYFYPNRIWTQNANSPYYLGIQQAYADNTVNVSFNTSTLELRDFYRNMGSIINRLPVIGMLYSCGLQNYILIGCFTFLCYHKKKEELILLLPSFATVIMCILSPINAYVRYMMPVMLLLPFNIAWCYHAVHEKGQENTPPQTDGVS